MKKEDLPTLGRPTRPALRLVPGRPNIALGVGVAALLGAAAPYSKNERIMHKILWGT